jgi:hypothetical protein
VTYRRCSWCSENADAYYEGVLLCPGCAHSIPAARKRSWLRSEADLQIALDAHRAANLADGYRVAARARYSSDPSSGAGTQASRS